MLPVRLAAAAATAAVLLDIPVEPDADTARRWAEEELTNPVYHERESLIEAAWRWLQEWFSEVMRALSGLDGRAPALILGSLVLVAALLVIFFLGPVLRARRARPSTEVFVDDTRTAAELRAAADAHAAAGRWSEAVLDRYRAVLRSLEERALLDERPGRTAHEAALEAATVLPTRADDLREASLLFDDVCYGDVHADQDDDARLREIDAGVLATRPAAPASRPETLAVPR